MKPSLTGLTSAALSILLLGSGCAARQPVVTECEPEVVVVDRLGTLDSELTTIRELPPVPAHGHVDTLIEWAMACATTARTLNNQMEKIRSLDLDR